MKFLKIKNLLLEFNKNAYSWLDTRGKFTPVIRTHGDTARNEFGINSKDIIKSAWEQGYFRVYLVNNSLYIHNEVRPLSMAQLKALINLAKDEEYDSVRWDQ